MLRLFYCTPWRITLPSSTPVPSTLGGPENQWNFNAYPIHQKITKMMSQDLPRSPNEVPRGTWSHQSNEKVEKVKSHENIGIYNTFERLDHQKSQDFAIKINQNSCMQSKQAFVHFKSQIIWKSDPKWSPERDSKSIKNHEKSILRPSKAPLCASLLNLITWMLPKDTHMTENSHLVTLILESTPQLSGACRSALWVVN